MLRTMTTVLDGLAGVPKGVVRPVDEERQVSRYIVRVITVPSFKTSYSRKMVAATQDNGFGQTGRIIKLCRQGRCTGLLFGWGTEKKGEDRN